MSVPSTTRALVLGSKSPRQLGDQTIQYHSASVQDVPLPKAEVVVRILCAGFNHRELWIRKGLYPAIKEGSTMGADGCGIVVSGPEHLLNKRVVIVPMVGWQSHPRGPDGKWGIIGGVSYPTYGTLSEYVALDAKSVILAPEHMSDEEAGAWGVGAVTAWRAVVTKAQIEKGHNVLITGIGGGVAMIALLFCLALGANVFVSSSNKQTIDWAVGLGAKGGVNYRDESWPKDLAALLKEHNLNGLDAIIDSAGGDLLNKTGKILNHGAKVVCYGMTASPSIPLAMPGVLKNIELLGSTMGSTAELKAATEFAAKHHLKPSVSTVLDGLENAEPGFELIQKGRESGKIVVRVAVKNGSKL
ncbi:zinc-binding dehydrogenase family oxidoreductase [Rhizoctonia solani 123E]|uniref:Zinc-binding dehydrogenase family oxidoreductase n=1 Tax=Rhizoctonia solani 123E TaxID=1423351 RepID=A0A074RYW7_9AGAM|nr:zinc-binding dehydrogenase family oxidoreductase [Rhizoctonia solani 123E]